MTQVIIERRDVDGIVLLDKPSGISSNRALQIVRGIFHAHKAGHTGSLDPLATGLLPVCLGEATKISAFLLDADKRYLTACRLGVTTTTGDSEGKVVESRPVPALGEAEIEAILDRFRGPIRQVPPMYSALKRDGKRLYELARRGEVVDREPREVTIHELTLLRCDPEGLELNVRCSKGTYIRSLVEDIGVALGCGAHVTSLRRLSVGPFDGPPLWTVESLQVLAEEGQGALDTALLPMDSALVNLPELRLDPESAAAIRHGQAVQVAGVAGSGLLRLYAGADGFIGVGHFLGDGRIAPRRLLKAP